MRAGRLPLVAIGKNPTGIVAIGGVATGVVAIGGVSFGVISIGINAVGVVAIGVNAIGPLAISAANSLGVIVFSLVNVFGGAGTALVNDLTAFPLGVAIAFAMVVAGFYLGRRRPPRIIEVTAQPTTTLAELDTVVAGEHAVEATLDRRDAAAVLGDGERSVTVGAADALDRAWFGKRGVFRVAVSDDFDEDESVNYREAATRVRRFAIVDAALPIRRPWLGARGDLLWLMGRTMQLGSVIAAWLAHQSS